MKINLLNVLLLLVSFSASAQLLQPTEEKVSIPKKYSLSIHGGATTVKSRKVTLNILAKKVNAMVISNTKDFETAIWIPYREKLPWELTEGEGVKHIYVKFKEEDGEETYPIFKQVILWKEKVN